MSIITSTHSTLCYSSYARRGRAKGEAKREEKGEARKRGRGKVKKWEEEGTGEEGKQENKEVKKQ